MSIVNRIAAGNALSAIVQRQNFVGWVFAINYESASIMTNDIWKSRVKGIPHNSFLLATSFDPSEFAAAPESHQEVVLLRVVGASRLPMDDDLVQTKIEHFQERQNSDPRDEQLDDLTRNQLQFSGLQCCVLGTFYLNSSGRLCLGSDLESYQSAVRLQVYKPRSIALSSVVNYISPSREQAAREEAQRLGVGDMLPAFGIGDVRYTSSNRLQLGDEPVEFQIQSVDFLSRRTGVFGMTRTGKSNMIKKLVSVVKRTAGQTGLRIGQIIYDLNGEYANANQQDQGSIASVYPDETVRYRMLPADGFELIQNNFFTQVSEGFSLLQLALQEQPTTSADLKQFLNVSFDQPEDEQNRSAMNRWRVKTAIYQAILAKAGYQSPPGFRISFPTNAQVRGRVDPGNTFPSASRQGTLSLSPESAIDWFERARSANREKDDSGQPLPLPSSTQGQSWLDEDAVALLNMLAGKNSNDSYITGYKHLSPFTQFHSPQRSTDVSQEIYEHLSAGRIVILDLSVGDPAHRKRLSTVIARHIFNRSMATFNEGAFPPNVVIYVEEAHNIMGKKDSLTETWPRIAKEGAKFRIATVYATQEVSSIHPNILANTENMFVSHLNNESEVKELAKFYDHVAG